MGEGDLFGVDVGNNNPLPIKEPGPLKSLVLKLKFLSLGDIAILIYLS